MQFYGRAQASKRRRPDLGRAWPASARATLRAAFAAGRASYLMVIERWMD